MIEFIEFIWSVWFLWFKWFFLFLLLRDTNHHEGLRLRFRLRVWRYTTLSFSLSPLPAEYVP